MIENTIIPTPSTGNWNEHKRKLKLKFPALTDADLHFEEGKKDEMMTQIQTKLNKTKEEIAEIISGL
ncbi:MAG TPA: general stress protein CsbD [Bacteroidia bacterium]|nr:general stress protein CsbD [Bacteroidia bacterium]